MNTKAVMVVAGSALFGALMLFQNCGQADSGGQASSSIRAGTAAIQGDPGGPSTPSGLVATVTTPDWAEMHWSPSTDNEGSVDAYRIYRNGNLVGTVDMNYGGDNPVSYTHLTLPTKA